MDISGREGGEKTESDVLVGRVVIGMGLLIVGRLGSCFCWGIGYKN